MWEPPVIIEGKEEEAIEYFVEESGEPAEAFPLKTSEPVSILTAEEEQNLQDETMSAAKLCMELYREVKIAYPGTEYSHIEFFQINREKIW